MSLLPEGEELRRAIKWISSRLTEDSDLGLAPLLQEAIFKFDLSPKDAEFLLNFYRKKPGQ